MVELNPYRETVDIAKQPADIKIGQVWEGISFAGKYCRFIIEDRRACSHSNNERVWGIRCLEGICVSRYWVDHEFVRKHNCLVPDPDKQAVRKLTRTRDIRRTASGLLSLGLLVFGIWFLWKGLFLFGKVLCLHIYNVPRMYPDQPWDEGMNRVRAWFIGAATLAAPPLAWAFLVLCRKIGTPS